MKKSLILILLLTLSAPANAETWRHWFHHHFSCFCVGNPPTFGGGK